MTAEVSKLFARALSLSLEEREALADSLISNLRGKVDEDVQQAWILPGVWGFANSIVAIAHTSRRPG